MQGGGGVLKNNKHVDQNKTVQDVFFPQNNKHACTSIRYTRVGNSNSFLIGLISLFDFFE